MVIWVPLGMSSGSPHGARLSCRWHHVSWCRYKSSRLTALSSTQTGVKIQNVVKWYGNKILKESQGQQRNTTLTVFMASGPVTFASPRGAPWAAGVVTGWCLIASSLRKISMSVGSSLSSYFIVANNTTYLKSRTRFLYSYHMVMTPQKWGDITSIITAPTKTSSKWWPWNYFLNLTTYYARPVGFQQQVISIDAMIIR